MVEPRPPERVAAKPTKIGPFRYPWKALCPHCKDTMTNEMYLCTRCKKGLLLAAYQGNKMHEKYHADIGCGSCQIRDSIILDYAESHRLETTVNCMHCGHTFPVFGNLYVACHPTKKQKPMRFTKIVNGIAGTIRGIFGSKSEPK